MLSSSTIFSILIKKYIFSNQTALSSVYERTKTVIVVVKYMQRQLVNCKRVPSEKNIVYCTLDMYTKTLTT